MKDAIEKINKEKELEQFIELQEINKKLKEYNNENFTSYI